MCTKLQCCFVKAKNSVKQGSLVSRIAVFFFKDDHLRTLLHKYGLVWRSFTCYLAMGEFFFGDGGWVCNLNNRKDPWEILTSDMLFKQKINVLLFLF